MSKRALNYLNNTCQQCVFDNSWLFRSGRWVLVGWGGGSFMGHPLLTRYGYFISQGFTFIFNTYVRVLSNLKHDSANTI